MRLPIPDELRREWPTAPARSLFIRQQRAVRESDGVVTAFRDGQVTLRSNRREEGFTNAIAELGYQGIRRGDLVIHSMDGFAGAIGVAESDGKASPVVHAYVPRPGIDARFYAYLLRELAGRGYVTSLAKGIRERSTAFDVETFRSLVLPVPDHNSQRAIADYLDTETARIEALIAKKQRLLGLLDERRNAAVRATISALDAPMVPLKRCWRVTDCKHRTPEYVEVGFPVVSPGDVTPGRLDLSRSTRFVDHADLRDLTEGGRRPRRGDIIYSRNASIGIASYVDTDDEFCMGQDVCLITSPDQDQLFLAYVLNSVGLDQLDRQKIGSTFSRVNVAQVVELLVPLPDQLEQTRLAREFDRLTDRVRVTQEALAQQIGLLREHRQALITAAVTGELEVPAVAA
jgi:type I restriction enzyme S subunit